MDENTQPKITGRTPQEYDLKMQALAMQVSEERLRNGEASSAEIVFWLKRASPDERLKEENLRLQNELLSAKTEQLNSERKSNEAYIEAMRAFAGYLPTRDDDGGDWIDGEFSSMED